MLVPFFFTSTAQKNCGGDCGGNFRISRIGKEKGHLVGGLSLWFYTDILARPERFERPTPWFVAKYSIQLSYGRIAFLKLHIIQSSFDYLKLILQLCHEFLERSDFVAHELSVFSEARWMREGRSPKPIFSRCGALGGRARRSVLVTW